MSLGSLDARLLCQAFILSGIPLAIWLLPFVGWLFPLVVLQLAVGIFMGPSVIGRVAPAFEEWLFSESAADGLAALSFWGVVFFVFYTGLHIEKDMFFGPRATLEFWILAFSSLLWPFGVGCFLGWLYLKVLFGDELLGPSGSAVTYILAIGIIVGVTALPVLSAILMELGQLESDLGILMIACATVHDVLLWLLITLIFGLAGSPENWAGTWQPLASLGLVIVLILLLGMVYSPLMTKVINSQWWQRLSVVPRLTISLCMMYVSALCSDFLQVHTLVGVVAFGACVPLTEKPFVMGHIDVMNRALFLPLFFGNAGLKVKLNQATSRTGYIFLGLTIGAIIGQLPGSVLTAKLFKRTWKQAFIIGCYMMCKGGVGIIVATLLLTRGIVNSDTFSGMMLMALACTAITKPLVIIICRYFNGDEDPYSLGVKPNPPAEPEPPAAEELPVVEEEAESQGASPISPSQNLVLKEPQVPPMVEVNLPNPYVYLAVAHHSMEALPQFSEQIMGTSHVDTIQMEVDHENVIANLSRQTTLSQSLGQSTGLQPHSTSH